MRASKDVPVAIYVSLLITFQMARHILNELGPNSVMIIAFAFDTTQF